MDDRDNLPEFLRGDGHPWEPGEIKPMTLRDYALACPGPLPSWILMRIKLTKIMRTNGHTEAEIAETVAQIQDPAVRFADEALENIMSGMPKS